MGFRDREESKVDDVSCLAAATLRVRAGTAYEALLSMSSPPVIRLPERSTKTVRYR